MSGILHYSEEEEMRKERSFVWAVTSLLAVASMLLASCGAKPTAAPTQAPVATQAPTQAPTEVMTEAPTAAPTTAATEAPSSAATLAPAALENYSPDIPD